MKPFSASGTGLGRGIGGFGVRLSSYPATWPRTQSARVPARFSPTSLKGLVLLSPFADGNVYRSTNGF